jgi:Osmosensitive K+ channel His kinase sensor domain
MSQQGRGQLRIYLGNAAGVGKTFAMLGEGHRRAERGTDVVVGFVETHGRKHTADLIEGLEVVPRTRIPYRGGVFEEMDLDAVLARRPQVALIDELAHTNVPGSRNTKRWQDVEELLDAGIDVISTVKLLSQRQLLAEVWGPGYAEASGNLRLYMTQLRRKLEPDPARPRWLRTEPGMGYRYQPETEDERPTAAGPGARPESASR